MEVLIVFFLFFAGIISYLLFAPFYLEISSRNGLCRIRFHRLASANLRIDGNTLLLELRLPGFIKKIDLFESQKEHEEKQVKRSTERKGAGRKISWRKIKAILQSFKINEFKLSVDSGDMQLNGILYPVFYLISENRRINLEINFIDENEIELEIENNLARISWAYLSS